jgi:hypothetical protein
MTKRGRTASILGLAVAACAMALGLLTAGCRTHQPEEKATISDEERLVSREDATSLELYFPDADDRLRRESREIPITDEAPTRIRLLIESLLAGPTTAGLFAPLPADIGLGAVQVSPGGIAYLDFESPEGSGPPPSGTRAEILTVYSIVDSVLLNVSEVRAVVLLWNGSQRFSFAGHLDTSSPLTADLDLLVEEL